MKKLKMGTMLCIMAIIAAGCASASPQLYNLSPAAKPASETSSLAVTVGPVSLPAAVDRPQLVLNVGPNQLRLDEFNRWAAPLKTEIARVVAENLSLLLGSPYVSVFPQANALTPAYRVTIDVTRFESVPGGAARLTAVWCARATADERRQEGATTMTAVLTADDCPAMVAAHSMMIGGMSGDIAAAIRKLAVGGGEAPAPGK